MRVGILCSVLMFAASLSAPVAFAFSDQENQQAREALAQKRYSEALTIFGKGAQEGDSRAQNSLGTMYQLGMGIMKSDPQAATLYRRAADQGYALAQFNLGSMYLGGQGVPRDPAQALAWYQKAAAQGDQKARDMVAQLQQWVPSQSSQILQPSASAPPQTSRQVAQPQAQSSQSGPPSERSQVKVRPSFNCAAERLPDEMLICSDERLSRADSVMADVFTRYRDRVDPALRNQIIRDQRGWLSQRNDACSITRKTIVTDSNRSLLIACLSSQFETRIQELSVKAAALDLGSTLASSSTLDQSKVPTSLLPTGQSPQHATPATAPTATAQPNESPKAPTVATSKPASQDEDPSFTPKQIAELSQSENPKAAEVDLQEPAAISPATPQAMPSAPQADTVAEDLDPADAAFVRYLNRADVALDAAFERYINDVNPSLRAQIIRGYGAWELQQSLDCGLGSVTANNRLELISCLIRRLESGTQELTAKAAALESAKGAAIGQIPRKQEAAVARAADAGSTNQTEATPQQQQADAKAAAERKQQADKAVREE